MGGPSRRAACPKNDGVVREHAAHDACTAIALLSAQWPMAGGGIASMAQQDFGRAAGTGGGCVSATELAPAVAEERASRRARYGRPLDWSNDRVCEARPRASLPSCSIRSKTSAGTDVLSSIGWRCVRRGLEGLLACLRGASPRKSSRLLPLDPRGPRREDPARRVRDNSLTSRCLALLSRDW
mmetsp:Transcript_39084/g.104783  ORF Transcript_39084/g.104783 Transcript_39084/m.104783 type:complete len:183 (+) Transcript_39084:214-762(+)